MDVGDTLVGLLWIGVLVVGAKVIHSRVRLFQKLFLPSSVIAGAFAMLIGPQALGRMAGALGYDDWTDGLIPAAVLEVWAALPGLLISVVFAALFIGKAIPSPRAIWQMAGPQVALGQSMAWGQYVVGLLLGILVLTPVFGLPPVAGALIEIGFEGGHGTAAGLADTFAEFDFAEGADLALGLATVGVVAGVLVGTVLINWAARTGRITLGADAEGSRSDDVETLSELDEREASPATTDSSATDPLSVHIGLVSIAITIGWVIQQGMVAVEDATWAANDGVELLRFIPLFPLAMIGGVILQLVLDRAKRGDRVDRALMNRISGSALDLIIVAALGTLSLEAIGANIGPFVILVVAGLAWNIGAFVLLAPRIIPDFPWERGFGDFGQSMGMTVTGLLLMRIADPTNRSGAMETFGYKQLLFEPVVGGGLFTAASIPLIAQFGAGVMLVVTSALLVVWLAIGLLVFGRRDHTPHPQRAGS